MSFRSILIMSIVAMFLIVPFVTQNVWAPPKAANDLQSLMSLAVNIASDNAGATVTFVPKGKQTAICVWAHRPIPGSTVSSTPTRCAYEDATVKISGIPSDPAILVSSAAQASATSWAPGDGTLAADGTCPSGSLLLTFTTGSAKRTSTVPCTAPTLVQ